MIKLGDALEMKDPVRSLFDELLEFSYSDLEQMSEEAKTVYFAHLFVDEILGDGFTGFFLGSSSEFTTDIVSALRIIGANVCCELLSKALDSFPAGFSNPQRRDYIINAGIDCPELERLDECFYEQVSFGQMEQSTNENLWQLMFSYIQDHRNSMIKNAR